MNAVMRFDVRTSMKLQRYKNPALDKILLGITKSANGGMIWIAAGLLLLAIPGYRGAGIFYFEVLAATAVVNNIILKSTFMRKRPCDPRDPMVLHFHPDIQPYPLRARQHCAPSAFRQEFSHYVWRL